MGDGHSREECGKRGDAGGREPRAARAAGDGVGVADRRYARCAADPAGRWQCRDRGEEAGDPVDHRHAGLAARRPHRRPLATRRPRAEGAAALTVGAVPARAADRRQPRPLRRADPHLGDRYERPDSVAGRDAGRRQPRPGRAGRHGRLGGAHGRPCRRPAGAPGRRERGRLRDRQAPALVDRHRRATARHRPSHADAAPAQLVLVGGLDEREPLLQPGQRMDAVHARERRARADGLLRRRIDAVVQQGLVSRPRTDADRQPPELGREPRRPERRRARGERRPAGGRAHRLGRAAAATSWSSTATPIRAPARAS